MMSVESAARAAVEYHAAGFNCAESVLKALVEELGLPAGNVPAVATGFGGGVGRTGGICGALTGAVMALGIAVGRSSVDQAELKARANEAALSIVRKFEAEMGSTICRDISGFVLCIPEQMEEWKRQRVSETRCRQAIEAAVRVASGLISTNT